MAKLRVLIAEDSITVRECLAETLSSDPGIEVVGRAENGTQAIALCRELRPDVITLDMMMPERSGLEATEEIMAYHPTPILIVSASTNRAELFKTYDALAAGAVDVMEKPLGDGFDEEWKQRLISNVKLVSKIKVITHPRARLERRSHAGGIRSWWPQAVPSRHRCAVIGVSTGGPSALIEIFRALPPDFPLPILFVLHISAPFDSAFAEWLSSQSSIPVVHATDGAPLPMFGQPTILMAPHDRHLTVKGSRLLLSDQPERHSCRPSVDVLFESAARELGPAVVGCLLTGMGRDGAAGLLAIRRAGGLTIAQDEASSVVYGMPREAARLGAAERILSLGEIAPSLIAIASEAAKAGAGV